MPKKKAPAFTLKDQDNKTHSLSDYKGKKILLFFYPKDSTPGCTIEACSFRDAYADLKKEGVIILGISKLGTSSKKKFAEKHNLQYPLLADEDTSVAKSYGVVKEKSMFGKKYMGISRESFLIDEDGNIQKHYEDVSPTSQVAEVMKDIKKG